MTPAQLKRLYQDSNPDGHFFDRETLKFFGDTMSNFGVRAVDGDRAEKLRDILHAMVAKVEMKCFQTHSEVNQFGAYCPSDWQPLEDFIREGECSGDSFETAYAIWEDFRHSPEIFETLPAWELYRKRPVLHGIQGSHYFDAAGNHLVIANAKIYESLKTA